MDLQSCIIMQISKVEQQWTCLLFRWVTTYRQQIYVCVCVYIYIYIYVCVCVCILSSTDCFIGSQLISVARHVGRFKLGLKPGQIYIRLSIILLSHQSTYIVCVCMCLCIRVCVYIYIYIYIYIWVCVYIYIYNVGVYVYIYIYIYIYIYFIIFHFHFIK